MSTVQQAIEVGAPLHTVYEQLAAFENYPRFMAGVEQVTQISDDQTHWVMDLDGQRREFDAQITECSLDERVSWSAVGGPRLAETITLRPLGETRTQIVAQLEADVALLMPSDRHGQESLDRRLKADLASFKRLIELDDEDAARQIAGTGHVNAGPRNAAARNVTSPASVAPRTGNRNAVGRPAVERVIADMGTTGYPVTDPRVTGGHRMQTGAAGMGGQAMSADDAWGHGMVTEEERGSAHDL